jgi:plastocyanin
MDPVRASRPLLLRSLGAACGAVVFGLGPACAARAGTIEGAVSATGPAAAGSPQGAGNYQSRRYKFAEKIDYEHLKDFVVSIDEPVPGSKDAGTAASERAPRIVQRDVGFDPHVLPIVVGTLVRWPNEDDIFHNVFSMSEAKEFDLGTYLKEKIPEVRFEKVGQVDVFCSIHSKMHCIILVLPSPYFAKSDANHRYVISNVPPGTYRLKAWHERLPPQVKTVTVPETGAVSVDFVLGLTALPKY